MIVDIGANRGQFALVARHYFPKARIISFEPLPIPALKYSNIFMADERAEINTVGIGPIRKIESIHISASDDSSSFLSITVMQRKMFPGTEEIGTMDVQIAPLSDFLNADKIEQPAMLKLDVQGYELEALKGCQKLLKCFDWIYVECSFIELYENQSLAHDVIAWLQQFGFRVMGIYNIYYDNAGKSIQADIMFTKL